MESAEDQPLGYLVYRLMSALKPHAAAELEPLGLRLPEVVCLKILAAQPGLSSAELARNNRVSAQAANQVLKSLEDRGAVTRPAPMIPGRPAPARLTPDGAALLERAEAAIAVADEAVLGGLTADEQRQLRRLLHLAGSHALDESRWTG